MCYGLKVELVCLNTNKKMFDTKKLKNNNKTKTLHVSFFNIDTVKLDGSSIMLWGLSLNWGFNLGGGNKE